MTRKKSAKKKKPAKRAGKKAAKKKPAKRKAKPKPKAKRKKAKSAGPVVIPKSQREVLVTTNDQIGRVFGVDGRSVRAWKVQPWWPVSARGPYDLALVGPARVMELSARHAGKLAAAQEYKDADGTLLDPDREKARFRRYKADGALQDLNLKRGELLPRGQVEQTFRVFFTAVHTLHEAVGRANPAVRKELARGMKRAKQDFIKQFTAPEDK